MSLNFKIIGKRINGLRRKKGLTQEKLAEMCNFAVSHISRVESAINHPSLECLVKMADVLDVTVDTFLYGNQKNDAIGYKSDLLEIFEGCNNYEKQIIIDIIAATRKSLHENNSLAH